MNTEKTKQDQLNAHINEVTGITQLVKNNLWGKDEALKAIEKSQFFWMSYVGGLPETNQLADKLWNVIVIGKKLCLDWKE
jgi:hypothetical protein